MAQRTILFRGKRIDNNQWIYGGYFQASEEDGLGTYIYDHYAGAVLVKLDTVGQFTGLTDKNGKRIFEGDIVNSWADTDSPYIREVIWGKNCGLVFEPLTGYTLCKSNEHHFEVIGNIHDNTTEQ